MATSYRRRCTLLKTERQKLKGHSRSVHGTILASTPLTKWLPMIADDNDGTTLDDTHQPTPWRVLTRLPSLSIAPAALLHYFAGRYFGDPSDGLVSRPTSRTKSSYSIVHRGREHRRDPTDDDARGTKYASRLDGDGEGCGSEKTRVQSSSMLALQSQVERSRWLLRTATIRTAGLPTVSWQWYRGGELPDDLGELSNTARRPGEDPAGDSAPACRRR